MFQWEICYLFSSTEFPWSSAYKNGFVIQVITKLMFPTKIGHSVCSRFLDVLSSQTGNVRWIGFGAFKDQSVL